jgi:hypothetical protein
MLCSAASVVSAGHVDCTVQAGQLEKHVLIHGSEDAYVVEKWDTPSGFRFAAQWLVPSNKLKTYVYYHGSKDRFALVHATEKVLAQQDCQPLATLNRVYSERMEYELTYRCQWVCDAPSAIKNKDAP